MPAGKCEPPFDFVGFWLCQKSGLTTFPDAASAAKNSAGIAGAASTMRRKSAIWQRELFITRQPTVPFAAEQRVWMLIYDRNHCRRGYIPGWYAPESSMIWEIITSMRRQLAFGLVIRAKWIRGSDIVMPEYIAGRNRSLPGTAEKVSCRDHWSACNPLSSVRWDGKCGRGGIFLLDVGIQMMKSHSVYIGSSIRMARNVIRCHTSLIHQLTTPRPRAHTIFRQYHCCWSNVSGHHGAGRNFAKFYKNRQLTDYVGPVYYRNFFKIKTVNAPILHTLISRKCKKKAIRAKIHSAFGTDGFEGCYMVWNSPRAGLLWSARVTTKRRWKDFIINRFTISRCATVKEGLIGAQMSQPAFRRRPCGFFDVLQVGMAGVVRPRIL